MDTYELTFKREGSKQTWKTLVKGTCEGDAAARLIDTYPKGNADGFKVTKVLKIKKVQ